MKFVDKTSIIQRLIKSTIPYAILYIKQMLQHEDMYIDSRDKIGNKQGEKYRAKLAFWDAFEKGVERFYKERGCDRTFKELVETKEDMKLINELRCLAFSFVEADGAYETMGNCIYKEIEDGISRQREESN